MVNSWNKMKWLCAQVRERHIQSGARTVSTTVLCTCVRQARRSAETSAAGVLTDDISATRRLCTRSASVARRTAATSGSSGSRLRLRGGTLVGRQRRLSRRRVAWVRVSFLAGGRPAVRVRNRRRHQPRLPEDAGAMFPAGRCHWR